MAAPDEIDPPGGDEQAESEARRVPLSSPGDVQREMARVYRAARFKRIESARANSLINALQFIGKLAEANHERELEERIAALEAQAAAH